MNLAKGAGSPFEEVCSGVTAAEIITAQLRGFQRQLEIANKNIATEQDPGINRHQSQSKAGD